VICFHGTSAQHDAAIQEDGLRAHWRSGGDRVDNQPGPYLAAHPLRAVCYALKAVAVEEIREGTRSRCAVYTLRVDRNALWPIRSGSGRVREFCVRDGGVPADGIRAVWLFDPAAMVEQLRAAGAGMPQWSDLGWYGGLGAWRVLEETMALERCAHELGGARRPWPRGCLRPG